jgi:hypothetical protein
MKICFLFWKYQLLLSLNNIELWFKTRDEEDYSVQWSVSSRTKVNWWLAKNEIDSRNSTLGILFKYALRETTVVLQIPHAATQRRVLWTKGMKLYKLNLKYLYFGFPDIKMSEFYFIWKYVQIFIVDRPIYCILSWRQIIFDYPWRLSH